MKRLLSLLLVIGSFAFGQDYDFEELCIACAEQNGFYCGDDPSNWTQYAPLGCVPNGFGGLYYINDGWLDCVDGSDEDNAVPTPIEECSPPPLECDTIYVTQYETIYDTIIQTEYITQIVIDTFEIETFVPEYIYITDTVYAEVLDTMFIDVVEEVYITVFDTVVEIEYVEFIITEYIDCETGLPCDSSLDEILEKSKNTGLLYNMNGQVIIKREGVYIENGKINYKL
jgi:hypothetical protein